MTKSRLNTRLENIARLTQLKNDEKKEKVRLIRKKEMVESLLHVNYTITGNLDEMQMEIRRIRKERKEAEQKMVKTCKQILRVNEKCFQYKLAIKRLQQLTYLEEDIEFYYWYSNQNNLFTKKVNKHLVITDPLLLKIKNDLPDEIINVVQEYFTYETKSILLESKYDPIKLINKFNSYQINGIIETIFGNFVMKLLDEDTKDNILFKYRTFYDCNPNSGEETLIRNITDERVFLKNIVLSFKPYQHKILYGLYRLIILLNKITF
jgi:hypothetical protein